MARARLLKPSFFANEDLADIPAHGRLLFIGLWTIADREGRLEDRPKRIKAALFPYENVSVEPLLKKLADAGFIVRYEIDGQQIIQIPSFLKHQNPHHREPESLLPAPDQPRAGLGLVQGDSEAEPQNVEAEPSPSRAVYGNQLPVTGDPVTSGGNGSLSASEREMVETILSKIPSPQKHDPLTRDECEQFARDFPGMFAELASAIAKVRQEGKFPYPSNLRRHMPGWQERSTTNGRRTPDVGLDPNFERNLEASGRHFRV